MILVLGAAALAACGSDTTVSVIDDGGPSATSQTLGGGGVKGPLAGAVVTVFDASTSPANFRASVVAGGTTDGQARLSGVALPFPLSPPYILEVTADADTTDLTTGVAPVIRRLRTVITNAQLNSRRQIYATPLTTMAVDMALERGDTFRNGFFGDGNGTLTRGEFLAALGVARARVTQTLGFGLSNSVDIFETAPIVDADTDSTSEQADTVAYRAAVEALTAIVFQVSQNDTANNPDATAALDNLVRDLGDGAIDGMADNQMVSDNTALQAVLAQDPGTLPIPNDPRNRTVADVDDIVVEERSDTGNEGTDTQAIEDGEVEADPRPAQTASDVDDDGVSDDADNCPGTPNADQADANSNGVGNACERVPVASAAEFNILEDTNIRATLMGVDDENDSLTFAVVEPPTNAALFNLTDSGRSGRFAYSPNRDFFGTDSFSFTVSDGNATSEPATVAITITGVNDQPTTRSASFATRRDTPFTGSLADRAFDLEGDELTFRLGNNLTPVGSVTVNPDGTFTYTPRSGQVGRDDFTYIVNDGEFDSAPGTVTIIIRDNPPPVARNVFASGDEDTVINGQLMASEVEGDPITYALVGEGPSSGRVEISTETGAFSYQPNANFNGSDSYLYNASDRDGTSETASVTIEVNPVNDAPTIDGTPATTGQEGVAYSFTPTANDIDGDDLTFSISGQPSWASFDAQTGALTGTPSAGDAGDYPNIVISVSDGNQGSASLDAFAISIAAGENLPPVANDGTASGDEDTSITGSLTATDNEGDAITYALSGPGPANGDLSITMATGAFEYVPDANFNGSDSFQFVASDDGGSSDPATISITVNPVNDAPTIAGTPATTGQEGAAYSFTPTANDIDGDDLTFSITGQPSWASFDMQSGALTGTPSAGDAGEYPGIVISVDDGNQGTASLDAFTITVAAAPVGDQVFNTGFFEVDIEATQSDPIRGSFGMTMDTGFYSIPSGGEGPVDITFGPFTVLSESDLQAIDDGGQTSYFFQVDPPGEVDDAEIVTLNRNALGVITSTPVFEIVTDDFTVDGEFVADRRVREVFALVPVRDDMIATNGVDYLDAFRLADSDDDGQGDYLDGTAGSQIVQGSSTFLEIALRQSSDFAVSALEGDYGFAGFGLELQSSGGNIITSFTTEHNIDSGGIGTGEIYDARSIDYDPNGDPASGTVIELASGPRPGDFTTTYVADETGLLDVTYSSQSEGTDRSLTGFATPDGSVVVLQEVRSFDDNSDGTADRTENIFQVGMRRPTGVVDPAGRTFRGQALALERRDAATELDSSLESIGTFNAQTTLNTDGTCVQRVRLGQDLFLAERLADNGVGGFASSNTATTINESFVFDRPCTYTVGERGSIRLVFPGTGEDLSDEIYEGYFDESGDRVVFAGHRDEDGEFHQRFLVVSYADAALSGLDNRQPTISVEPAVTSVQRGETIGLTATVADPDSGPQALTVEWFATIGTFSSQTGTSTSWTAPPDARGSTLLTAVVSDGQANRIFDVQVDFGRSNLPVASAEEANQVVETLDTAYFAPNDLDFLFTLFNPFDTIDQAYNCPDENGNQVGTVTQTFNDNDSDGEFTAGDTASITFNDCQQSDNIVRNGMINFEATASDASSVTYTTVVDYNEALSDEFVEFTGAYTVFDTDLTGGSGNSATVSSATDFAVVIDESDQGTGTIESGLEFRISGGYSFTLGFLESPPRYTADGSYTLTNSEIVNDAVSSDGVRHTVSFDSVEGDDNAGSPNAGTEAGVGIELAEPDSGVVTVAVVQNSALANFPTYEITVFDVDDIEVLLDLESDGSFDRRLQTSWGFLRSDENSGAGGELQGPIDERSIVIDGQIDDWGGQAPNASESNGDSTDPAADITGLFVALDGGDYVFRTDVSGNIDLDNWQYSWTFLPYNEADTPCAQVTADFNDFSGDPSQDFCHLFVGNAFAPGGFYNGCGTNGGDNGILSAAQASTLEIRVPRSNFAESTHLKVFAAGAASTPNFDGGRSTEPPLCLALPD